MKIFSLVLALGSLARGNLDIDTTDCRWLKGHFGAQETCGSNEVAVSSCGSGKHDDCDWISTENTGEFQKDDLKDSGTYHAIKCCKQETLAQLGDCTWQNGNYGSFLTCPALKYLNGQCGSGRDKDCSGYTHQIQCCSGTWDGTSEGVFRADEAHCRLMGDFGDVVDCGYNEMAFGRCGSGEHADCQHFLMEERKKSGNIRIENLGDHGYYHGLQCCPAKLDI